MNIVLKNWKTSLAGVILIGIAAASTFFGVHVPGFNMDLAAALTTGLALIVAKDGNVSGT